MIIGFREIEAWYVDHIKAIRNHVAYRDCLLVIAIECNTSQIEPGRMKENIENAVGNTNIMFTSSLKNGSVGVWTGAPQKEDYAKTLLELLAHDQLRFAEDSAAISSNWKEHKLKWMDQANKFRMIERVDPNSGDRKVTYSGKAHCQGDDAILSSQIGLSNHKQQRMNPDFMRLCQQKCIRF